MVKKPESKRVKKIFTPTFIRAVILLIPVTALIVYKAVHGDLTPEDFFSIDTFTAIIMAFLCQTVSELVVKLYERRHEDTLKLTRDSESLVKRYNRTKLLRFGSVTFPQICLVIREEDQPPFRFVFDHGAYDRKYELPAQIAENADHLMEAHAHSRVYNQQVIRLDKLEHRDGEITVSYSKSFYYDSLITNRSMDYPWKNGKTVREVYEPGPFISDLENSRLSNHIGFNGFLETADGRIILVRRGSQVSVGKNTWSCSVSASLKAKYALNDRRQLDADGITKAIRMEIHDELYLDIPEDVDLSQHIFAFYRDLTEGGKPQFLFYYRLDCDYDEFLRRFKEKYRKQNNDVDGTEFMGLTPEECRQCRFSPSGITHNAKEYGMAASSASSLAMLLLHLKPRDMDGSVP